MLTNVMLFNVFGSPPRLAADLLIDVMHFQRFWEPFAPWRGLLINVRLFNVFGSPSRLAAECFSTVFGSPSRLGAQCL